MTTSAKLVDLMANISPNLEKITTANFLTYFNLSYFSVFSTINTCIEIEVTRLESDFTKTFVLPKGLLFMGSEIRVGFEYHKDNVKNGKYDFSHFDNFIQLLATQNYFPVTNEEMESIKNFSDLDAKYLKEYGKKAEDKKRTLHPYKKVMKFFVIQ